MQLGYYFDQNRCISCYTCVVACKDWNDVPAGPASWRRVVMLEGGKYPQPFVASLTTSCYHCAEPACVDACPENAISKRAEDGIVVVNREACTGKDQCAVCLNVCPYESPQFGSEENPKMQKCDLCLERWQEGKLPICVASCPTRALDAGPIEAMEAKHGTKVRESAGFAYNEQLQPSVVFKPKKLPGKPTKTFVLPLPFSRK